jgi:hypothetical protein
MTAPKQTPEQIQQLYKRAITDFTYFCSLCKVPQRNWKVSPVKSRIVCKPLKLSKKQIEFIEFIESHSETVVLKSRQKGFTTILLMYCLWKLLYHKNESIVYITRHLDLARGLVREVGVLKSGLPKELVPPDISDTNYIGRFFNKHTNSKLFISTATESVGRGEVFSMSIIDEYAFYEDNIQKGVEAVLTSACPTNRIWVSTPKCEQDEYHKKVIAAEKNGNLFTQYYWDGAEEWYGSMDNALVWRAAQEAGLNQEQINRELDCLFKGSAENLIWQLPAFNIISLDDDLLDRLKRRTLVTLDLGFSPDPTAILYAGDIDGVIYLFDEDVLRKYNITEVANTIQSKNYRLLLGTMDCSSKRIDQTSGTSSHQLLGSLLGIPFLTKKGDRISMRNYAQKLINDGKIKFSDKCIGLREMFDNFGLHNGKIPVTSKYKHLHDAFVYLVYNYQLACKQDKPSYQIMNKRNVAPYFVMGKKL